MKAVCRNITHHAAEIDETSADVGVLFLQTMQ
jgi:hypothetical protein